MDPKLLAALIEFIEARSDLAARAECNTLTPADTQKAEAAIKALVVAAGHGAIL